MRVIVDVIIDGVASVTILEFSVFSLGFGFTCSNPDLTEHFIMFLPRSSSIASVSHSYCYLAPH